MAEVTRVRADSNREFVDPARAGPPKRPDDWGQDALAKLIEDAHYNIIATFSNLRVQYDALKDIQCIFSDVLVCLNNNLEIVPTFLFVRSHSSFVGAVQLCLGGQLAEAYMVLRGCLESALYGLYIAGNDERAETWLRRHDDEQCRQRVQSEFKIRKMMDHLLPIDAKTHKAARLLYERTIDCGGHPNERAVLTQIRTRVDGSRIDFTANHFICGDAAHKAALRSTAQIGICCLDIFYHVFRERYRILGIDLRLDRMRQGF